MDPASQEFQIGSEQQVAGRDAMEASLAHTGKGQPVTNALIALNLLVFLYAVARGAGVLTPASEVLIHLGSNYAPDTLHGQWWRLVTSLALNFGALQLVLNLGGLLALGPTAERLPLLGPQRYLALYLMAGVVGGATSIAANPGGNSVGASGAVMGICGALLAVLLRGGAPVRALLLRQSAALGILLAGTLALGLLQVGVGIAASVGGLIAGFVGGLVMVRPVTGEQRPGFQPLPYLLVLLIGLIAPLLVLSFRGDIPQVAAQTRHAAPTFRIPGILTAAKLMPAEPALNELRVGAPCAGPAIVAPHPDPGGTFQRPHATSAPDADLIYPERSRALGEEGRPVVGIDINESGGVTRVNIETSSGFAELDNAALKYVARMSFSPATLNGAPGCVHSKLAVRFALTKASG